jgi:hypothetical protein
MKKLLTICPMCGKKIYGRDIDINKIQQQKIEKYPFRYIHCHSHGTQTHAITMYLDSHFAVRGKEVADFIKIEDF